MNYSKKKHWNPLKVILIVTMLLFVICTVGFNLDNTSVSYTQNVSLEDTEVPGDVEPSPEPEINYMAEILVALSSGDLDAAEALNQGRNEKIDRLEGCTYQKIDATDLYLIAKIIEAEAGSHWLPDDWKMSVGEVVLNRVASPEFPDTVSEVIYQQGQYYGSGSTYFNDLIPTQQHILLALRLIEGHRIMDDPTVVFQANFKQGSAVHTALYDKHLGWTYFCVSSYPELYN